MKYFFIVVAILVGFSVATNKSSAFSFSPQLPFFGKVISTVLPGAVCAPNPQVVFLLNPIPYYVANPLTTKKPIPGGWILGLYDVVPNIKSCFEAGEIPYPVRNITIYGVSK